MVRDEVPVLRAVVFREVSEIAVASPGVFGGHTTDGYASLKLLVDTALLRRLLMMRITTEAAKSVKDR
jgi:hypothetical protein